MAAKQTRRGNSTGFSVVDRGCAGSLNPEIFGRRFASVGHLLILDNLPFIQTAEAGLLNRGDVDEHVLAAATLRLNKSVPFLRIEPLHGTCRHRGLQKAQKRACRRRDHRAGRRSEFKALSSEGPIWGVRQTMPKLRMDSNLLASLGGGAFFWSEKQRAVDSL
jgi:hypothetical protein